MKKFFFNNRVNFLFLFISLFCIVFFLGIENISFQSTKWLYNGQDADLHYIGWYFFQNDIWRFPLGMNPNYGDELGSSIVYSDSIPILAIFFKLFKSLIPGNFQYFSFWYFICFYLQLYFSFKILKKFTSSDFYSLIGSIFFIVAPIFIYRMNWNAAIAGHWIIIFILYLSLTQDIEKSKLSWIFIIIFSPLVNYWFAVFTLSTYSLLRIFNLKLKKENIFKLAKDFFIISTFLLLGMYIVGYFEVRMADTLGMGFGAHKLNLLSPFDPINSADNISWSWFLSDIKLSRAEEFEGFNYFGLGQIMMLIFVLTLLFKKKHRAIFASIENSKEIKTFVLISIFFTIWALSNKISFGSHTLLEIPLNKYIFAILSIAKSSGRLFWIVNYFILVLLLIIIFKCFNKKNAILIISIFLIIQIGDTSAGTKQRINVFKSMYVPELLKDQIWDDLFKKYKIVKTTYPISWSRLFTRFSYPMEKYNIKKTNIVSLGRMNRKSAANGRYFLYDSFRKRNLSLNTVYVVDNLNHLRHLKYIYENENVGFFYRDDIWIMVANEKDKMDENDKKTFNGIKPKVLEIKKENNLNFNEQDNYYGFGWSHNLGESGIWSEGPISTLFFRTDKDYGDLKLKIICEPYITKKNRVSEFDIYVNNIFNQNVKLVENDREEIIEILLEEKFIKNNEIKVDFNFKNLVSPYEVLESPDSRKLGILVKNIAINPI